MPVLASRLPRPLQGPLPWLLAAALLPVAFYLAAERTMLDGGLGLPLDDGWIHLVFARNLARGEGLSFNAGELVTGSSAPLWTAIVSLFFLLPGDPLAWTKAAGVACHLASVAATYLLARELALSRALAALAAALTLSTYWLVWSALSGMEIPLFTLLSLAGMVLHLRERRRPQRLPLALPVLALSALARPEGGLLFLLALADRLLVPRREEAGGDAAAGSEPGRLVLAWPPWGRLAAGLALAALAAGPALVFHLAVGGSPLPHTYAVKAGGGEGPWAGLRYLHLVFGIFFKPQPVMALLAPAGALRLLEALGGGREGRMAGDRGLLPALWVLGLPLAGALLSPPGQAQVGNFGRYFFPLFPPLIVLGLLGAERAAAALAGPWRPGGHRLPVGPVLAGLVLVPTLVPLAANAGFYATNLANVEASDVRLGRWVRDHLPAGAVLALEDIGAVKYLAGNEVVDLVGLVSPELVRRARAAAGPGDPAGDRGVLAYLEERRPDYLAAFTNYRPRLTADPRFRPLLRIEVPANITMGGDELVLYETPWNRFRGAAPVLSPPPPRSRNRPR